MTFRTAHAEAASRADIPAHDAYWLRAMRTCLFTGSMIAWSPDERRTPSVIFPLVELDGRSSIGVPDHPSLNLMDIVLVGSADMPRDLDAALDVLGRERSWDLLRFSRVRERSHLLRALHGSSFTWTRDDAGRSAFCDVSAPSALTALSKDHLRNVDRLARRAQRDFGLVEIVAVSDATVASTAFDRFVALESSGWKGEEGTGLAADTTAQAFFREVMRGFQSDGRARIDVLTIDGRDAAAQLAVRVGTTWFLLKIGYDQSFRDVGPGAILLKQFLERMAETPDIHEVNLTTDPPWAQRWHFQSEPCYHVSIFGRTLRGRALAASQIAKSVARNLRDTLSSPDSAKPQ